jgi:hypothetical protein
MKIATRAYVNPHSFGTMLFDLELDPGQVNPILDGEIERRMVALMVKLMRANEAPLEQYERLGLPADGDVLDEHLLAAAQYEITIKAAGR